MSTPGRPDWQTQVFVVETVTDLSPPGATITSNGAPVNIDTTAQSSVGINIGAPVAASGKRYMLEMEWTDPNGDVFIDTATFHSSNSYGAGAANFLYQAPVRAQTLRVRLIGDTNDVVTFFVQGSSRVITTPTLQLIQNNLGRLILDTGSVNLLAGATSATFFTPPVARAIAFAFSTQTSAGHVASSMLADIAGAMSALQFGRWDWTVGILTVNELAAPMIGGEWTMTNDSAAAHNYFLRVWDVS